MKFPELFVQFFFPFLIQPPFCTFYDESLVVTIAQGKLLGWSGTTLSGRKFSQFLGVPYAQPPKRFQPPLKAEKWKGIRNATTLGSKCGQFRLPDDIQGGEDCQARNIPTDIDCFAPEDCLVLNVYTPVRNFSRVQRGIYLPVLVFFHGGAFQNGGFWDSFGPEYLMEQDVVYVAVNYRLGALGFLSTGDGLVSGNNGLKDQVMALKFVHQNIQAFGGDPKRVTIIGESAGASAVSYHLLSPMSKGLFSGAISISGSALSPWAVARRPWERFGKLAKLLKCDRNSTTETLKCLVSVDYRDILRNQALPKWFLDPIAAFGPVVENITSSNCEFLTEHPFKLLSEGPIANRVPWIAGDVKNEGLLLHASGILKNATLTKELDEDWNRVAPLTFMYDEILSLEDQNKTSELIREFYFGNKSVSNSTVQNLADLYSDRFFVYSVQRAAKLYAQHGIPTYLYLFTYAGEYTDVDDTPGNPQKFVSHGDDIQYLLHASFRKDFPVLSVSAHFVNLYNRLWTSFASSGAPKSTWGDALIWPKLDTSAISANTKWYRIDSETNLLEEPFYERMQFWENLMLTKIEEGS